METVKPVEDQDEKVVGQGLEDIDNPSADDTALSTEAPDATKESGEVDPYKVELERLQQMSRQKDGAIKEERRRRKEAEAKLLAFEMAKLGNAGSSEDKSYDPSVSVEQNDKKFLTAEEAEALLEKRLQKERFEARIESFTTNEDERKLIQYHYENSIVRTGDVAADLQMAAAIANQHIVQKAKELETQQRENEAFTARISRGGTVPRSSSVSMGNIDRAAAQLLENLGAKDAIKHLGSR